MIENNKTVTDSATPTFEMTVDLNVLEHLGINLYSNVAAVLTKAVANAWDADASSVQIRVDPNNEWIEIEDDGIGMSVDDLNGKYLRVGYRRRDEDAEHGCKTAKGRPAMGRKGLGKLSLFSIADVIEVQSFEVSTEEIDWTNYPGGIRFRRFHQHRHQPLPY